MCKAEVKSVRSVLTERSAAAVLPAARSALQQAKIRAPTPFLYGQQRLLASLCGSTAADLNCYDGELEVLKFRVR